MVMNAAVIRHFRHGRDSVAIRQPLVKIAKEDSIALAWDKHAKQDRASHHISGKDRRKARSGPQEFSMVLSRSQNQTGDASVDATYDNGQREEQNARDEEPDELHEMLSLPESRRLGNNLPALRHGQFSQIVHGYPRFDSGERKLLKTALLL
jgi:hypothetical protein